MVQTERILRTASPHLAGQERAFRAVPRTPRAVLGRSIGRCWRRRLLFPSFLREFGCWRDSQEFNSWGFLKEWLGLCAWPTFLGLVSWVRFPPCCAMPTSIRSASPGAGDIELALEDIARADADCIGALTCSRSSFSYHRLPKPRLRLTIRKLDASYFDVQIARSAAVWELKAAIESLFIALYDDTEKAISWQHVWSHFCLCFKDEKLTDDKATLRAFGIRDGDELHFAQHLSVNYSPCKSLSKKSLGSVSQKVKDFIG